MSILKIIFLTEFVVYCFFELIFNIIEIAKIVRKKYFTHNQSFNEKKCQNNETSLVASIFILVFIITAIFFNNDIVQRINFLIFLLCFCYFTKTLLQVLISPDLNNFYSFDFKNFLGFFTFLFVFAIYFNMDNIISNFLNNINNKDAYDTLLVMFILCLVFIYIFFIIALIPCIFSEFNKIFKYLFEKTRLFFNKIFNLMYLLINKFFKMIIVCFESIDKTFDELKDDKTFFSNVKAILIFIIKNLLKLVLIFIYCIIYGLYKLIYYILNILLITCYFFDILSKTNNELYLSFFIRISIIFSLLFTYIILSKNQYLISYTNYTVFEFLDGTILIPLIYDSINEYKKYIVKIIVDAKTRNKEQK